MVDAAVNSSSGHSRQVIDREDVVDLVLTESGQLSQIKLHYEADLKILWLTIAPEPKPVFTLQLLTSVVAVQNAIVSLWGGEGGYQDCPVRFLAFRGEGAIFTLGGDLDFYLDCLATNNRAAMQDYARLSVEGAALNASGLKGLAITISTIHAKAVGGGIDAPRSCNIMIAEERAAFSYPEVKFNHFPITAVAVLSRHMPPWEAKRMLMTGDEYSAAEFHAVGGCDAVVANGTGEDWIRRYAAETLPMHAARTALFGAFHARVGDFREELAGLSKLWTDCMMRMAPKDISKLQRIAQAQERMLSRMYRH